MPHTRKRTLSNFMQGIKFLGIKTETAQTGTKYIHFPAYPQIGKIRIADHPPNTRISVNCDDRRCRYGLRLDIKEPMVTEYKIQGARYTEYSWPSADKLRKDILAKYQTMGGVKYGQV